MHDVDGLGLWFTIDANLLLKFFLHGLELITGQYVYFQHVFSNWENINITQVMGQVLNIQSHLGLSDHDM